MKYKIISKDFRHATNEFACEIDFFIEGQNPLEYEYYASDFFSLSLPVTLQQIQDKIRELGEKHKNIYEMQKMLQLEGELDFNINTEGEI